MLFATVVVAAIACNQTLTIILVHQLFCGQERERGEMAVNLENTAVVVAPLIPWSIAAAAPLAPSGRPRPVCLRLVTSICSRSAA